MAHEFIDLEKSTSNVSELISSSSHFLNPSDLEIISYRIVCCYYAIGEYEKIFQWSIIIDEIRGGNHHFLRLIIRLILLVMIWESSDIDVFQSQLRSLKRFKKEKNINSLILDEFLHLLVMLYNSTEDKWNKQLKTTRENIEHIESENPEEQVSISFFPYYRWIDAIMEKKSTREIFKK